MIKIWKTIEPKKYKNIIQCISELKRKRIHVSIWIEDIAKNKKNKIKIIFIVLKSHH